MNTENRVKYVFIKAIVEYQRNDRVVVQVKKDFFKAIVREVRGKKVFLVLDTGAEITIPLNRVKGYTSKKMRVNPIPKHQVEKNLREGQVVGTEKEEKETKGRKVSGKKSKKININRLKQSPDRYIPGLKIKQIIRVMDKAADYYYNTGKILLSDEVYNKLEDELRDRNPGHSRLKKVGAPIRTTRKKIRLPFFMPSLGKLKSDTVDKWATEFPGPYLITDKMDGVSLLIVGERDTWKLYTRGDGKVGQDISYLAPFLKLPPVKSGVAIRTELEMKDAVFKALKSKDANPRNSVSGIVVSKEVDIKKLRAVDIIAYELLKPSLKPSAQMKKMKSLGFKIAKFKVVDMVDAGTLSRLFEARKKKVEYAIDGLVVTQDEKRNRPTSGEPKYSKAFKMLTADNIATVRVKEVVWSPSKWGFLKPRIRIEPVRLSGVRITYCSGFNGKFIKENLIGPGAVLQITRAGDVIPHVLEVLKPAKKPQLPKNKYEWNESGVDIFLVGKEESDVVKVKSITSFFRTVGVEDFSTGLVKKLYEAGLDSILKIVKAGPSRLEKIPGVRTRTATKITEGIKKRLGEVQLHRLMFASGEFGKDLGSRRLKFVLDKYPKILTVDWDDKELRRKLLEVPGFSTKLANYFIQGLPKFKSFLEKVKPYIKLVVPKKVKRISSSLEGQQIAFTGFRDKDLERLIEQAGGTHGSMTRDTTILLVKDVSTTSSKMRKARERGVKIMTEDKFRAMFSL